MFNKVMQAATVALLVSTVAGVSNLALAGQSQTEATHTKTIIITGLMNLEDGYVVRHVDNQGHALNLIGASTFGDAKIQKLLSAAESKTPLTVVVKGNQIVDIL